MAHQTWHLSLRQLEIFRAVAETGSIRAAARRVHLTQPAATHAVRELERAMEAPLFTRSVKGVSLTEIGESLLRRTRLLFNELARAQEEITQLRDGTGGCLSIAFSSAAATLLSDALVAFRAQRPGVDLELQELSWPNADQRWHGGGYDFAVVSEYEAPADDGMHRETLKEFTLAVMAREGHPLARSRSLAKLRGCAWLVPGYGRALLRRLFAAQRHPEGPASVVACQSTLMALTLLRRTDALALLSTGIRDTPQSAGLVSVPVAMPPTRIPVNLLVREPESLTPAARLFVNCLRQAAGKPGTGGRTPRQPGVSDG
ncbi:LysR family transcriptional regulator [Pseudorhodoferax sp.]|uniref:LysR family transcriptional regulator n=1 Tax=Pseudorhodoferax sp. TaxID=1993553 RepID=UPI002DD68D8B|nr:LysR substrate-binding domain-containing protein [Pseudorhodoferax sp.]